MSAGVGGRLRDIGRAIMGRGRSGGTWRIGGRKNDGWIYGCSQKMKSRRWGREAWYGMWGKKAIIGLR